MSSSFRRPRRSAGIAAAAAVSPPAPDPKMSYNSIRKTHTTYVKQLLSKGVHMTRVALGWCDEKISANCSHKIITGIATLYYKVCHTLRTTCPSSGALSAQRYFSIIEKNQETGKRLQ